jgi:hypothetical protein
MTAPTRFILLVIAVVCAAGALMVPGRDEWLAMMRDEDKQAQIIALLEPRLERNGNDIGILATLARSYAEIGNYGARSNSWTAISHFAPTTVRRMRSLPTSTKALATLQAALCR